MDKASFCVAITKCGCYRIEEVREAIRRLFTLLGSAGENPLARYVFPGNTVVLKPNWISERHQKNRYEWDSVITHPAIVTSILEFVLLALKGSGKIIIADAPQTDSSFSKILKIVDAEKWKEMGKARGIPVEILDLREDEWTSRDGVIVKRKKLPSDPKGSVVVDLKDKSAFSGKSVPVMGYYGADYASDETTWAHSEGRNIYKVSRSIIEGDVFINLPKLKTHKKAGMTVCMKNLVGINTYKNYLPHCSLGPPKQGGDEFASDTTKVATERMILSKLRKLWANFPSVARFFVPIKAVGRKIFGDSSKVVRGGAWYGNDTLWRIVIDLNRILLYANSDGTIRQRGPVSTKHYLAVVDSIVAGEGAGPEAPERVNAGILIAGTNPLAVDCSAAKIIGFDYSKIQYLREAFNIPDYPIADFDYEQIKVVSDWEPWNKLLKEVAVESIFSFKPSPGWTGHIELK
jgi:uncharacterized protein (DUF362 family)